MEQKDGRSSPNPGTGATHSGYGAGDTPGSLKPWRAGPLPRWWWEEVVEGSGAWLDR